MQVVTGIHEVISERFDRREAILWVSRLGKRAGLADLQGKSVYLMVSVKNPNFSGRLVSTFCDLVETHQGRGEVILVDTPYASTISAIEANETARRRELEDLQRVTNEKRRLVERILAKRSEVLPCTHSMKLSGRFRRLCYRKSAPRSSWRRGSGEPSSIAAAR